MSTASNVTPNNASNIAGTATLVAALAAIAFDPNLPLAQLETRGNARTDLGDLDEITASVSRHGVLVPIAVIQEGNRFVLWTGHRRVEASRRAGKETIPANIYPPMDDVAFETGQITENLIRSEMGDVDIYKSCKKLMSLHDGWQRKDLATHLGKSTSTATIYLAPEKLIPEALDAFLAGKFSLSKAYSIVKSKDQHAALAIALSKGTRKELDESRKPHEGKVVSYTIPFEGALVSVKGPNLTLFSFRALLKNLAKKTTPHIDENQTLESFELWMTNQAAAPKETPDPAKKKPVVAKPEPVAAIDEDD